MHIKTAAFIGGNAPKVYQSHKRRGQCFWRKVIKEFNESPLSLKDFCSERTLAVSTFQGWRRRLSSAKALTQKPRQEKERSQSHFLPVYVTSPERAPQEGKASLSSVLGSSTRSLPNSSGLVLFLNEDLKLSIDEGFHEPTLQRLVQLFSSKGAELC